MKWMSWDVRVSLVTAVDSQWEEVRGQQDCVLGSITMYAVGSPNVVCQ